MAGNLLREIHVLNNSKWKPLVPSPDERKGFLKMVLTGDVMNLKKKPSLPMEVTYLCMWKCGSIGAPSLWIQAQQHFVAKRVASKDSVCLIIFLLNDKLHQSRATSSQDIENSWILSGQTSCTHTHRDTSKLIYAYNSRNRSKDQLLDNTFEKSPPLCRISWTTALLSSECNRMFSSTSSDSFILSTASSSCQICN